MNTLMNTSLSMTSREVAELTGKRHDNVIRDIDKLVASLSSDLRTGFKSSTYVSGDPPREYRQFILDRDSTYCLVAGYDANARMRIIKRWQELEAQLVQPTAPAQPLLPEQRAESIIGVFTRLAAAHGVPMSFAMQLASVEATKISGLPFDRLLTQAACMNAVPDEDVMLEPTELGKRYGISGQRLNSILGDHDLQMKIGDNWIPTEDGLKFSQRHAWSRNGKSGYNLKWRVSFVDDLMSEMA